MLIKANHKAFPNKESTVLLISRVKQLLFDLLHRPHFSHASRPKRYHTMQWYKFQR